MSDPFINRVPPHDLEAEMAVLGAALNWPDAADVACTTLVPAHFYRTEHQKIFSAIMEHRATGRAMDLTVFSATLRAKAWLEEVGGQDYLIALSNSAVSSVVAPYYAALVKGTATKRAIIQAGYELQIIGHDAGLAAEDATEKAERLVFGLSDAAAKFAPVNIGAVAQSLVDRMERGDPPVMGYGTGLKNLDEIIGGLHPGELIILAARPGEGKSTLAMNLALQISVNDNNPVGLFSLEMSQDEVALRAIASRGNLSLKHLRDGQGGPMMMPAARAAADALAEGVFLIDDSPALKIGDLFARSRRMVSAGVKVVIVDYLQLVHGIRDRGMSRQEEVASISRGLKHLAREYGVPVLAVAQLGRSAEGKTRPQLSDLRESGAQEQDADVVMLLYRIAEGSFSFRLKVAKQRNGKVGTACLTWMGDTMTFKDGTAKDMEQMGQEKPDAEEPHPF